MNREEGWSTMIESEAPQKAPSGAWNSAPSPAALQAIGGFIVAWQQFELNISLLIAKLLQIDAKQMQCFVPDMSISKKFDLISSWSTLMVNEGQRDRAEQIRAAVKKARSLNEFRNDLVHFCINVIDDGTIFVLKVKAGKEVRVTDRQVTVEEVIARSAETRECSSDLMGAVHGFVVFGGGDISAVFKAPEYIS